jgi:hypothetical protein
MARRVGSKRSSAIVPRAVFATAVVAVVPACARSAGQGTAAQPAAIVGSDAGALDGRLARTDVAMVAFVRDAAVPALDVATGDTTSEEGGSSRDVVANDAGATAQVAIDGGAPPRRHRRERPAPVPTVPGDGRDRFRLYGVARSTFENDPRRMPRME